MTGIKNEKKSESYIESRVCLYYRQRGFLTIKFTSVNRRSVPDRIFIGDNGVLFFVEFKATGKKPTVLQDREIKRLREKGQKVFVIDDIKTGIRSIDEYLRLSEKSDRLDSV